MQFLVQLNILNAFVFDSTILKFYFFKSHGRQDIIISCYYWMNTYLLQNFIVNTWSEWD